MTAGRSKLKKRDGRVAMVLKEEGKNSKNVEDLPGGVMATLRFLVPTF